MLVNLCIVYAHACTSKNMYVYINDDGYDS